MTVYTVILDLSKMRFSKRAADQLVTKLNKNGPEVTLEMQFSNKIGHVSGASLKGGKLYLNLKLDKQSLKEALSEKQLLDMKYGGIERDETGKGCQQCQSRCEDDFGPQG